MNPILRTLSLLRQFVANSWRLLVGRRDGQSTSPTGILIQLAGLAATLYGLYLFSPSVAFITGGVIAVYVGERL